MSFSKMCDALVRCGFTPIFDENVPKQEFSEILDLVMLTPIKMTLHTENKDKTFGLFSDIYKYILMTESRKSLINSDPSKRLDCLDFAEQILDSCVSADRFDKRVFVDSLIQAIYYSGVHSSLSNDECLVKFVDILRKVRTTYLNLISQRDNLIYFTFEEAQGEYAFRASKSISDSLVKLSADFSDFSEYVIHAELKTTTIKAISANKSCYLSKKFYSLWCFEGIEVIKGQLADIDWADIYIEFETESYSYRYSKSDTCTCHYINGDLISNYDAHYCLSDKHRNILQGSEIVNKQNAFFWQS
ncbi:hypothetical protein [Photobacterium leiognathi]|uniref:hypothetical protein n=1 Tax=Photobacterium leiognathi TaxID=553611 RepID=UPI002980F6A7|nr:hypothetical protein [Photobacterium leiognathi]